MCQRRLLSTCRKHVGVRSVRYLAQSLLRCTMTVRSTRVRLLHKCLCLVLVADASTICVGPVMDRVAGVSQKRACSPHKRLASFAARLGDPRSAATVNPPLAVAAGPRPRTGPSAQPRQAPLPRQQAKAAAVAGRRRTRRRRLRRGGAPIACPIAAVASSRPQIRTRIRQLAAALAGIGTSTAG